MKDLGIVGQYVIHKGRTTCVKFSQKDLEQKLAEKHNIKIFRIEDFFMNTIWEDLVKNTFPDSCGWIE